MNKDPPGDSNKDFQWKCRIGERKPAVIVTRQEAGRAIPQRAESDGQACESEER
jgi:hypothetical protein